MAASVCLTEVITLSEGGAAPTEIQLLADGENPTRKGFSIVVDDVARAAIADDFSRGGVDLPIDLEHAQADPDARPSDRAAMGWFRPEFDEAGNVIASAIDWTPQGRANVESKSWRYTSVWVDLMPLDDEGNRFRVTRLRNFALTNTPAVLGVPALLSEDSNMATPASTPDTNKDVLALSEKVTTLSTALSDIGTTLGVDSPEKIKGAIQALKLSADKASKLEAELSEIKLSAEKAEKTALIKTLSDDGKLPPSLHDWAQGQSMESLKAFGEKAPKVVGSDPVASAPSTSAASVATLSEEEKTAADLLGVTAADALKAKQGNSKA